MTTSPSLEIVVAQYNEDLSWLNDFKDSCVVYSKGGPEHAPALPYEPLPNIGREGHTYLHHIVEHYDSLPDVTIFLQGQIEDHVLISINEIVELSRKTKPGEVTTFSFRELELFDLWDGIPWELYPSWNRWSSIGFVNAAKTPAQYWKQFFKMEVPESVGFQPGAIFATHRETIQRYPREVYREILQELFLGDMAHFNPETGHHMERFWLAMWQPSEYICWNSETDMPKEKRNAKGQWAKGHWHRTPRGLEIDEATIRPTAQQLPSPPSSETGSP
ncbi:hypothetical protein MMC16_004329 [Acarospora aff. strigata]|nr:hypothetical protein [Acarospora aff. strigata]